MGTLLPLAIVNDYPGLHAVFRQYVEDINVSRDVIDDSVGWAGGYAGKSLSEYPSRGIGKTLLGPFLQSLGLVLIVAQDRDAFNQCREFLPPRQANQARPGNKSRTEKKALPAPRAKKRGKAKYE